MDIYYQAAEALPALIDRRRLRCFVLAMFHSMQIACPKCHKPVQGKAQKSFLEFRRTSCRHCKSIIHILQGTPFNYLKITPEQFIVLAAFIPLEKEMLKIRAALGVGPLAASNISGKQAKDTGGECSGY
jgi:hypothetical protein